MNDEAVGPQFAVAPARPAALPLYPKEAQIAEAVLGPGRRALNEWNALAVTWARYGLPQPDPLVGRRYWPAVRAWLDSRAGLRNSAVPAIADGKENWNATAKRRARA